MVSSDFYLERDLNCVWKWVRVSQDPIGTSLPILILNHPGYPFQGVYPAVVSSSFFFVNAPVAWGLGIWLDTVI